MSGRNPELGETRRERLELRLHTTEREALERGAGRAALSVSEWLRVVALTAAGENSLLAQLKRVGGDEAMRTEAIRNERIDIVFKQHRAPLKIEGDRMLLVQFVPSGDSPSLELDDVPRNDWTSKLRPFACTGWNTGFSFDGPFTWTGGREEAPEPTGYGYALAHRDGFIEMASTNILRNGIGERLVTELIDAIPRVSGMLQAAGMSAPLHVAISLLGVQGAEVAVPRTMIWNDEGGGRLVDREHLLLPVLRLDTFDGDARALLQKPLDRVWQAGGYPSCPFLKR